MYIFTAEDVNATIWEGREKETLINVKQKVSRLIDIIVECWGN